MLSAPTAGLRASLRADLHVHDSMTVIFAQANLKIVMNSKILLARNLPIRSVVLPMLSCTGAFAQGQLVTCGRLCSDLHTSP